MTHNIPSARCCDMCPEPATEKLGTGRYCYKHFLMRLESMEQLPEQKPEPKRLRKRKNYIQFYCIFITNSRKTQKVLYDVSMSIEEMIKRLSNYIEALGDDVMFGGTLRIKAVDVKLKLMDLAAAELELRTLGNMIAVTRETEKA